MKRWKIVSLILVISLIGLAGFGCYPKEEINEMKLQITEQETQIAELKGELSTKDAKIHDLEAELSKIPQDPNHHELRRFLIKDQTQEESYQNHTTYAHRFLRNASEKGIQGYPVVVLIHHRVLVFVGFETTDKGWIYILPAIDREVELEVGESYRELNGFSPFGSGEDTILEIMIFN